MPMSLPPSIPSVDSPTGWSSLAALKRDRFFWVLAGVLALLTASQPQQVVRYPSLVDGATLAALTGLLALTQALESSCALRRLGHWLLARVSSERVAAWGLVSAAALLSTVLTNDVALFVVVPLTLELSRITSLPATRLVIFEALAVNVGSALTPIGNPQNLFLWQMSGVSFAEFVWHMAPLVAVLFVLLLALTTWAFRAVPLVSAQIVDWQGLDRWLLGAALCLYGPFVWAADRGAAAWGCAVVLGVLLALRPRVLMRVDWGLLLVFVLMFIDLRLIAELDIVRAAFNGLGLADPHRLYATGIVASQAISNVPATIALASYTSDWRVLAYAVNVGGFGFAVGSLANLIALRMAPDPRAWTRFHGYAVPCLGVAAVVGYVLLFVVWATGS